MTGLGNGTDSSTGVSSCVWRETANKLEADKFLVVYRMIVCLCSSRSIELALAGGC